MEGNITVNPPGVSVPGLCCSLPAGANGESPGIWMLLNGQMCFSHVRELRSEQRPLPRRLGGGCGGRFPLNKQGGGGGQRGMPAP